MSIDFFANGLCFYCHLAKRELSEYSDFHSRTERYWKQQDEELQAQVEELRQRYPDADQADVVESHGWELHLNQSRYPDIYRTSLVVGLYMFLEQQLNGLCETLSQSLTIGVRLEDLSGKGIERAFLFLRKVALFDLGRVSSLSFVREANRLRNKMVHAGGLLPPDPQDKVNRFVTSAPGVWGKPGAYLKVGPEFVDHLIKTLVTFFEELDNQVQEFIQQAQQGAPRGRT